MQQLLVGILILVAFIGPTRALVRRLRRRRAGTEAGSPNHGPGCAHCAPPLKKQPR